MQNSEPIKNNSQNSLNQSQVPQSKLPNIKNVSDLSQANSLKNLNSNQNIQNLPNLSQSQNQIINTNPNINNNAQNSSSNLSLHESQSSLQNQNLNLNQNSSNLQGSANFPSKEYFNFQFFKRQMSSQSSDIDFVGDNKEGLNDFFAARFNSVLSKDSSKQQSNNYKNSLDRNSCDLDLSRGNLSTNLGNKDEQPQIFLTRANSASSKKCSNYIPKTFYFQSHNSTTPSCFYKKSINNINQNINNDQNLVLRYYGNNNEYNLNIGNNNNLNKNKFLDVINDKDDENEDDDGHDDDEDGEDSDDDCIITSKEDDNFSINYLSRKSTNNITLPKRTFTLVHRNSSQLLNKDKGILNLRNNIEEKEDKDNGNVKNKKKLPPVKTNTYCGSSKNNLNIDNDKENDNEIDDKKEKEKDKDNDEYKKEDSEFFDSKSNIDKEEKEKNDGGKENEKKNKNEESKKMNESNDIIPDFSELKNFKSKKENNSNNNSQNEEIMK